LRWDVELVHLSVECSLKLSHGDGKHPLDFLTIKGVLVLGSYFCTVYDSNLLLPPVGKSVWKYQVEIEAGRLHRKCG
jgi:hypothetical protein